MRRQIVIGWVIVSSITEGDLQEESEGRRRCSPIDSWSLQRRVGRGGRMCSICYQWWSKKRWLANLGRHSLLLIRSLERRWGTQNCNEAVLVGNGELHNRDVVRKDGPGSITFSLLKGYGEEQRKLIRMYLRWGGKDEIWEMFWEQGQQAKGAMCGWGTCNKYSYAMVLRFHCWQNSERRLS